MRVTENRASRHTGTSTESAGRETGGKTLGSDSAVQSAVDLALERSGWEESREVGLRCLRDPESVDMLSQAGDNTAESEDTSLTRRVTQGRRSILGEKRACKNKDGWHGFSHITWRLGQALGCTGSF